MLIACCCAHASAQNDAVGSDDGVLAETTTHNDAAEDLPVELDLELERPAWRFAQSPPPAIIEQWETALGDPDRPLTVERSATRFLLREGADFEAAATDRQRRLIEARRLMRTDVVIRSLTLGDGGTGQVPGARRGLRLLAPARLEPDQDQVAPTRPIVHGPSHQAEGGTSNTPVLTDPIPAGSIRQDSAIVADSSSVSLEWDITGGWALRGTGARRRFADEINYVAVSAEAAYPLGTTGGLRIGYDLFRQALPGEQTFETELPQDRVFMEFQWRF